MFSTPPRILSFCCSYACDPSARLLHSADDTRLNAESEEVKAWFAAEGPPQEGKQQLRRPCICLRHALLLPLRLLAGLPWCCLRLPRDVPCLMSLNHNTPRNCCAVTLVCHRTDAVLHCCTAGYSFICECFFMTARALQLGLGKGIDTAQNLARTVRNWEQDIEALRRWGGGAQWSMFVEGGEGGAI
jgi:hypothetical protein